MKIGRTKRVPNYVLTMYHLIRVSVGQLFDQVSQPLQEYLLPCKPDLELPIPSKKTVFSSVRVSLLCLSIVHFPENSKTKQDTSVL